MNQLILTLLSTSGTLSLALPPRNQPVTWSVRNLEASNVSGDVYQRMQSELHLGRCSLHGKRWATKEPKKFHILVYVLQCVTIHTTTGCYGEEKRKKKLHMVYYLHYTLEHKNHDMCVLASFAKVQRESLTWKV